MTWSDGGLIRFYINGVEDTPTGRNGPNNAGTVSGCTKLIIGQGGKYAGGGWDGLIDDVRIYGKALTPEQIKKAMRGEPDLAWGPQPVNEATTDIEKATPLTWSPGDKAAKHDVYLGTNQVAVESADRSDTTGIYRGRQDPNTYTPPEGLQFGQTYYWRVDEFNTDATLSKGRMWSFTVAEYLIVDDFEAYDDFCERIFYSWTDGFGYSADPTCGVTLSTGNGTGSTVGNLAPPFAEQTIIHEGLQSMPMAYDNTGATGKARYSETQRQWASPQDWTRHGVKALTLWFRGLPASVGSYSYNPGTGIHTMTADGEDIWNVADFPGAGAGNYHDEFHFAYKRLSGVGSIQVKVLSVSNTNAWAKAGVMIRQTLDANSVHAMVVVTPASGVSFQRRVTAGASSASDTQAGITAPQWVKLERTLAGAFIASHSADGSSWTPLANPVNINMQGDVYIGLALTSHNVNATCIAEFSDVSTTGTVTGQWQSQDIGIVSNMADQLYVAVQDSTGNSAVVNHEDAEAVLLDTWQEWSIDLKEFTAVNLKSVKKMYLGVGNRNNPKAGGSGALYFDDIRLYQPRCMPDRAKPAGDFNNNCVVDLPDLEIMAGEWLLQNVAPGEVADVMFEAESAGTMTAPLQSWSDRPDALAGKYIAVIPGNNSTGSPPAQGQATYVFQVKAGVYKVLARVIAPSGSDDSFWLRIEGATTQTTNHSSGWVRWSVANGSNWHWAPVQSMDDDGQTVHFTMAAGTYTMEIAYREDGTLLDAFLITDNLDLDQRTLLPEGVSTDLNEDGKIDLKNYALLVDMWLDEQLWPVQ
jgi:hypothetical protein